MHTDLNVFKMSLRIDGFFTSFFIRYENENYIQPTQQPHSQGIGNNSHAPIPHNIRFSAGETGLIFPCENYMLIGSYEYGTIYCTNQICC